MPTFHSTVSRRTFMKGLGLAGAGLGAAAAAPAFHDLDEVAASSSANWKRSWWVKELEHGKASVEIDWNLVKPINRDASPGYGFLYNSSDHPDSVYARQNKQSLIDGFIKNKYPSWTTDSVRNQALNGAGRSVWFSQITPSEISTPEELGLPKWTGTPEENLNMVRAALRFFGATDVAVAELDTNMRKLIFSHQSRRLNSFEDVDDFATTDSKNVLPNKARYVIVWTVVQPTEVTLREGSTLGGSAVSLSYARAKTLAIHIQQFLKGIGYIANGSSRSASNPFGALTGVGEHTRQCNNVVSPEYGVMIRVVNRMMTDLPLPVTSPIDAGIFKFCETCKICAERCPFDALPMGDPSYEVDPDWNPTGPYGYKGYYLGRYKCAVCGFCQAICPFNSMGNQTFIHDVVKATLANTPIFNGFFANMESTFGYGFKEPDSWWDLKNEPVYGVHPNFSRY